MRTEPQIGRRVFRRQAITNFLSRGAPFTICPRARQLTELYDAGHRAPIAAAHSANPRPHRRERVAKTAYTRPPHLMHADASPRDLGLSPSVFGSLQHRAYT